MKAVHADGKLGYIQPVGAAPRAAGFDATDVYGVGAFYWLAVSFINLLNSYSQLFTQQTNPPQV